jgi:thioredoxin reductase (NADPH)
MSDPQNPKVIVIGSGPAGFTAAIYLSRANLPNLLFEGSQPGGQLTITTAVENYPGFPDGVQGPELTEKFRAQAARFGTVIKTQEVQEVDFSRHPFQVVSNDKTYEAPAVIVATGSSARWLGLPEEESFHGKGLSACATCDGFFFRDQEIAVIGGGDTAVEEALFLTNFAKKVTVVHRRDELRASAIMQQRAFDNAKIEFAWNRVVQRYVGDENGNLTGLELKDTRDGSRHELQATGCFVAIGHVPNTQFLGGQLELDQGGYIVTAPDRTATSVEGVFAAGDVQDHVWRQAVTAAGTGCMAALEAERWLGAKGH